MHGQHRHYTQRDIDAAAAWVSSARQAWQKFDFRQVTEEEITTTRRNLTERRAELTEFTDGLTTAALRVRYVILRLAHACQVFLGLEDRYVWIASLFFGLFALLLILPVVLIVRPAGGTGATVLLLTFATATCLGLLFLIPLSAIGLRRTLERMRAERQRRLERAGDLRHEIRELEEQVARLQQIREAQLEYEKAISAQRYLEQMLASERYQLQVIDWRSLRGVPFEEFLARVFRMLGYEVETTKASGDQGVDLVITGKGRKVAVQSKGYGESVGNKAVQEVFAGKMYYQCTECVVITNSQFTSGAVDLATSVGCRLIDGSQVPALIEGQIY
jgi:HJR/Mrr/RecB family endonuclease